MDLSGNMRLVTSLNAGNPGLEGWITPAGGVYLQSEGFNGPKALLYYASPGTGQEVATPNVKITPGEPLKFRAARLFEYVACS